MTNPANTASVRVGGKIGMQHQGSTDRYYNTACELFTVDNPGLAAGWR